MIQKYQPQLLLLRCLLLQENSMKLREVFATYDVDRSGGLNLNELEALVADIMGPQPLGQVGISPTGRARPCTSSSSIAVVIICTHPHCTYLLPSIHLCTR